MTWGQGLDYPSYDICNQTQLAFYAALFKQIRLWDLSQEGRFALAEEAYLNPIAQMAQGRVAHLPDILSFSNRLLPQPVQNTPVQSVYAPLNHFPEPVGSQKADLLIFSFDRPLQLYACLESIQRYMTGVERCSVLYRVSSPQFAAGYEQLKNAFPEIQFIAQSGEAKKDFKPNVIKIVFDSPSQYILFAVDDIIVKDFVDLRFCMEQMQKTGAYGFYLRFGKHIHHCYQTGQPQSLPPSVPIANGVFAWPLELGEADWGFPNSLDMTLYAKESLKKPFAEMKYKTPNSLEYNWANEYPPTKAIGLYFERSKLVNIPMNVVGRTGNPHMNYLTAEELLVKFDQGLKLDIEPFYKMENGSPHIDYIPEFITRF